MPETRMAVIDHQRSSIETYFYKISKIKAFNDECLRMICLIFGPRKISNLDLHAFQANSESNEKASSPMARTYFQYVSQNNHKSSSQIDSSQDKKGRQTKSHLASRFTWGEAEMVALESIGWRQREDASCFAHCKEQEKENLLRSQVTTLILCIKIE